MLELLGMFTLAQWIWVLIVIGSISVVTAYDYAAPFTVVYVIIAGLLFWYNSINPLVFFIDNFVTILLFTAVYLVVGFLWSIFKYDRHSKDCRAKMDRDELINPSWFLSTTQERIYERYFPSILDRVHMFYGWIVFWPFSMLSYIFGRMLWDILEWMLTKMRHFYTSIAYRHFKDVLEEKYVQEQSKFKTD